MRRAFLIFFLIFNFNFFNYAFSQSRERAIIISPVISAGSGTISSRNLPENLHARDNTQKLVPALKSENKYGFNYGFGVMLQYQFIPELAIVAGLEIKCFNSTYIIYSQEDKLGSGTDFLYNYTHKHNFNINYLHLPLLLKISPFVNKNFYFLAGANADIITQTKLESNEITTLEEYNDNELVKSTETGSVTESITLDQFKSPRLSLAAGIGASLPVVKDKKINFSISYSLPITSSVLYSTTANTPSGFRSPNIFRRNNKINAENQAPQFMLNDFKMSAIYLSLSFDLIKEGKAVNSEQ